MLQTQILKGPHIKSASIEISVLGLVILVLICWSVMYFIIPVRH